MPTDYPATTLPGILERRRKRQAAMKLGSEFVKPEVLEAISDPGFRRALQAVGEGMASGDVFIDDAVDFLGKVPQRQIDPSVAKFIESQLTPESSANIPQEAAQPQTVPAAVQNRLGPYVEQYAPPGTGLSLKFPTPPAVMERERAERVKTVEAEETARQKLAPLSQEAGQVVASAEAAIGAIDELFTLEQKYPGVMKAGLIPGAKVFGSEITQLAELALKTVRTELITARGGKNLTKTEIAFIKTILPSLLRRDKVNFESLKKVRTIMSNVHRRVLGPVRTQEERQRSTGEKTRSSFKYIGVAD